MKQKTITCPHCKKTNSHYGFQCAKNPKNIKSNLQRTTPDPNPAYADRKEEIDKIIGTPIGNGVTMTSNKMYKANKKSKADKSISELLKLAEIVFNRFIRKRDAKYDNTFQCISCQMWYPVSEMDCGHYISKKSSAIRFNEDNCHGQCRTKCNNFLHGNPHEYQKNLIWKIGIEKVRELHALAKQPHKWEREELLLIIEKYK